MPELKNFDYVFKKSLNAACVVRVSTGTVLAPLS